MSGIELDLKPGEHMYYLFDEGRQAVVHAFPMKSSEAAFSNQITLAHVPARWITASEWRKLRRSIKNETISQRTNDWL